MKPKQTQNRHGDASEAGSAKQTSLSIQDVSPQEADPPDPRMKARERLIRALANPLEVRLDADLIRGLGVSEEDVRAWMDEPDFQTEVDAELVRRRGEARAAVWRALIREALKGSFQHIKLYLELAGDIRPRGDEPEGPGSPVVIIRPGRIET
ncbi:MAG: hypothetical protein JRG73_18170 [Deltaproteobacteria bacterium]|nr:hypothetical protein [Deltaproteobacteria bacterium]